MGDLNYEVNDTLEDYTIKPYSEDKKLYLSTEHIYDEVNKQVLVDLLKNAFTRIKLLETVLLSSYSYVKKVANIEERDNLIGTISPKQIVYVKDAFDETGVNNYAIYMYNIDDSGYPSWLRLSSILGYSETSISF